MVEIRAIGGFHLGGRAVRLAGLPTRRERMTAGGEAHELDPNGEIAVEQVYVHQIRLARPLAPWPVVLIHGGGMSGVTWEDTPDGRPGWQWRLVEAGFDVLTPDAVERGRAGWAPYPAIFPGEPVWRTKEHAWMLFRFGAADGYASRTPFPGQRFPVAAFDQFARQFVPRWSCNDRVTQAAYDALLRRVGPCVLVAHSQGGAFAMRAARAAPDLVKALVAVEPSGAPDPAGVDMRGLARVPHLAVWGDFIAGDPRWQANRRVVERWWAALPQSATLDLPARGVRGNSHFPMMDDNADEVLALVLEWLRGYGLAP